MTQGIIYINIYKININTLYVFYEPSDIKQKPIYLKIVNSVIIENLENKPNIVNFIAFYNEECYYYEYKSNFAFLDKLKNIYNNYITMNNNNNANDIKILNQRYTNLIKYPVAGIIQYGGKVNGIADAPSHTALEYYDDVIDDYVVIEAVHPKVRSISKKQFLEKIEKSKCEVETITIGTVDNSQKKRFIDSVDKLLEMNYSVSKAIASFHFENNVKPNFYQKILAKFVNLINKVITKKGEIYCTELVGDQIIQKLLFIDKKTINLTKEGDKILNIVQNKKGRLMPFHFSSEYIKNYDIF